MDSTAVLAQEDLPMDLHLHRCAPPDLEPATSRLPLQRTFAFPQQQQHHSDSVMAPSLRSPVTTQDHPLASLHTLSLPTTDSSAVLSPPPQAASPLTPSTSTCSSTAAPGSSPSSTGSLERRKRDSSEDARSDRRLRSDSSLTGCGDARLSICSTSGTVYESVVVVGHIYGSDNVVYYLLEVKSYEMPLEGYVIRRRYNDFKELHHELQYCMPLTGGVRRGSAPAATPASGTNRTRSAPGCHRRGGSIGLSSLLCNPLSTAPPETSPLWSPTSRPRFNSIRRNSLTGALGLHGLDDPTPTTTTTTTTTPPTTAGTHGVTDNYYDTRFSAPNLAFGSRPPWSYQTSQSANGLVDLPFHAVSFDRDGRPLLPSMPPGGVSSFFTTREMLIKYRIEKFNRILAAVLSDTSSRVSQLLMNFIQDKPSAPQSYVSLNQYAPVDIPWSVERHARRRATTSCKRDKDKTPVHLSVAPTAG